MFKINTEHEPNRKFWSHDFGFSIILFLRSGLSLENSIFTTRDCIAYICQRRNVSTGWSLFTVNWWLFCWAVGGSSSPKWNLHDVIWVISSYFYSIHCREYELDLLTCLPGFWAVFLSSGFGPACSYKKICSSSHAKNRYNLDCAYPDEHGWPFSLRNGQNQRGATRWGLIEHQPSKVSEILWSRWWFQTFFVFTPIWGRFPFWLIFFKGVETTN